MICRSRRAILISGKKKSVIGWKERGIQAKLKTFFEWWDFRILPK